MQFKSLALLALSSLAFASNVEEKRQIPSATNSVEASVISVLATAMPISLILLGENNATALSAELASSLSAGNTPSWYAALPTDVKSYLPQLFPVSTAAASTAISTSSNSASASLVSSISSVQASISASISSQLNSTAISSVSSATLKTTSGSGSAATTAAGSSSTSTGGASYPTGVVGAGVAGAIGILGMLAL